MNASFDYLESTYPLLWQYPKAVWGRAGLIDAPFEAGCYARYGPRSGRRVRGVWTEGRRHHTLSTARIRALHTRDWFDPELLGDISWRRWGCSTSLPSAQSAICNTLPEHAVCSSASSPTDYSANGFVQLVPFVIWQTWKDVHPRPPRFQGMNSLVQVQLAMRTCLCRPQWTLNAVPACRRRLVS